jgi:hypothetical protein
MRAILGTYVPITWGGEEAARALADARAEMYPGAIVEWVPRGLGGGGFWQAVHPDAEGLAVTDYLHVRLPEGTTLQRRDSVRVGDIVWSSHSGTGAVAHAATHGVGPDGGTTHIRLKGAPGGPDAYPANLPIPVISRADPEPPDRVDLTADEVLCLVIEARRRPVGSAPLVIDFPPAAAPVLHVTPDTTWVLDYLTARRAAAVQGT